MPDTPLPPSCSVEALAPPLIYAIVDKDGVIQETVFSGRNGKATGFDARSAVAYRTKYFPTLAPYAVVEYAPSEKPRRK